jgi:hypothetical protein
MVAHSAGIDRRTSSWSMVCVGQIPGKHGTLQPVHSTRQEENMSREPPGCDTLCIIGCRKRLKGAVTIIHSAPKEYHASVVRNSLVPKVGFEPTRAVAHCALNAARLPDSTTSAAMLCSCQNSYSGSTGTVKPPPSAASVIIPRGGPGPNHIPVLTGASPGFCAPPFRAISGCRAAADCANVPRQSHDSLRWQREEWATAVARTLPQT